MGLSLFRC